MPAKNSLLFIWDTLKIIVLALVIVLPIRYFIFQPFIVRGESMEPNFHDGDYLVIDEISYRLKSPERGDVIIFRYPWDPSEKFIKRIIALPGETVELSGGQIKITDDSGASSILDESAYLPDGGNITQDEKIVLAGDEYFVFGDNRLHSFDSRSWGALPRKNIIGKAIFRLYPPKIIASFLAPQY